jgi:hypothetical protein
MNNLNVSVKKSTPAARAKAAIGVAQWMRSNSNAGHCYCCVPFEGGYLAGHPYRDKFVTEALGSTPAEAMCNAMKYLVPSLAVEPPTEIPALLKTLRKAGWVLEPNDQCTANGTGTIFNLVSLQLHNIQRNR